MKIKSERIVTPKGIISGIIEIEKDKIIGINQDGDFDIDLGNLYLSPGFIDLHIHGANGHSFYSECFEDYIEGAKYLAKHGITSFAPTATITSVKLEDSKKQIDALDKAIKENKDGANILGLHMEGPYGSVEFPILPNIEVPIPNEVIYKEFFDYTNNILRVTLSPQTNECLEMIKYMKSKGIFTSIGHTGCNFEQVNNARALGVNQITHIYSAMSSVFRKNGTRYMGVLESALYYDDLYVEMIANGKHLSEELMKFIIKVKGPDKVMIVSDANEFVGHEPGKVKYLGYDGIIEDGVIYLESRKGFLGSVTIADEMLKNLLKMDISIQDCVKMLSTNSAKAVYIDNLKGSIEIGKDADLVAFDDDGNIKFVSVLGKIIN